MRKEMKGIILILMLIFVASVVSAQTIQNVEVHGYMQNRFYTPESGSARIVTERVSLSAIGQMGTDGTAYIEMYLHPWMPTVAEQYRTYLESAYVDLPLAGGRIRVGKGRQLNFGVTPSYPNRKTSQYSIVSETFTQDRIVGAQFSRKQGSFDMGATLYSDYRIGTRSIGTFPNASPANVVPHFVNKDDPANPSGQLAGSLKLGMSTPTFSWHVSGAVGQFLQADADTIAAAYGTTTTNRDHNMYGVDATYKQGKMIGKVEWYNGDFSFMNIKGFSILAGYEPKDKMRVYARYETLDNDQPATANPRTWDTKQFTVGIVKPIRKGVWAELNYERNMESPPAGVQNIKNDLLFLELFTGF